jgi:hypothetical protein
MRHPIPASHKVNKSCICCSRISAAAAPGSSGTFVSMCTERKGKG